MHLPPKVKAPSVFDMSIHSGPLRAVVDLHHTKPPQWVAPGVAEPPRACFKATCFGCGVSSVCCAVLCCVVFCCVVLCFVVLYCVVLCPVVC